MRRCGYRTAALHGHQQSAHAVLVGSVRLLCLARRCRSTPVPQRPCQASTATVRRETRDCATRRTPRGRRNRRGEAHRGRGSLRLRMRPLIVLLWRAGLRISEALALAESDLDRSRGCVLVRRGKGGKRRQFGMDAWAWEQLEPGFKSASRCASVRCCAHRRPDAGAPVVTDGGRATLRHLAVRAGVRRRFASHQLRHAPRWHAKACRSTSSNASSYTPRHRIRLPARHGHSEIIKTVRARAAPTLPASAGLR